MINLLAMVNGLLSAGQTWGMERNTQKSGEGKYSATSGLLVESHWKACRGACLQGCKVIPQDGVKGSVLLHFEGVNNTLWLCPGTIMPL